MFFKAPKSWMLLASILLFIPRPSVSQEAPPVLPPPDGLRCEYLENPVGIDVEKPRFSWRLHHPERGQKQTAYQVIVSSEPEVSRGELWDSGKVVSDRSFHVAYDGLPLESDRTYYWKVRYWDGDDRASPYSRTARFDTGLFRPEDWEAQWITGSNQLRREFALDGAPARARAYVCGLGYYELRINGKKVGKNVLDPGFTNYEKRVLYTTYDVTAMLREGENAVAVMLGKGWSTPRLLLLQINVELEDGSRVTMTSDGSWKSKDGPILSDSLYDGEVYDARWETPGWDLPGYDDSLWSPVQTGIQPKGELSAQMIPPIRVVDTIVPLEMTQPRPGVYVFDMGQNFSGWAELKVSGPRGTEVRLRYAELLYPDGTINQENLRSARAEDVYILKGEGEERYEPRFTYHGFRYVELTGFPGVPTLETLRGKVVHSAVRQEGNFSCSHPLLNRLQRLILWSQKTNLHSIPTDCNQRDERMGWLADAHLTAEEALHQFDMGALYTKFIGDIRDTQDKEGTITDTAPHVWGQRPADPAWGAAYPLLCWYMYRHYGDERILEEHYRGVKAYVEFLRSEARGDLLSAGRYGDWVAVESTPGELVSSFFYAYDVQILAETARVLGYAAEEKLYRDLAERIKKAFHRKFFDPETRSYGNGSQTAQVLALFLDMVPDGERGKVLGNLRRDIVYARNTHLSTGIIGTKYVMDVLTRFGAVDLAYELAVRTSYPSWGYMISRGATTLWELWQYKTGPSMNSHNHPMLGSVGAWLYRALAGIDQPDDGAGFKRILIRPRMVGDLRYAAGTVHTLLGPVSCSWARNDRSVRLEVRIPVNAEAEVRLPKLKLRNIVLREGGRQVFDGRKFLTSIDGIRMVVEEESEVVVSIGSGVYSFELEGE